MEMVEIYHPILDRTTEVPIQSLEHLNRSGWILASEKEAHLNYLESLKAATAKKEEAAEEKPKRASAKKTEE